MTYLIERKDRAFYKTFASTASIDDATKWMRAKIAQATTGLHTKAIERAGAREIVRVASVGGIFPSDTAGVLHTQVKTIAESVARSAANQKRPLPDALIMYVIGIDADMRGASSLPHVVCFKPFEAEPKRGLDALRRAWTDDR